MNPAASPVEELSAPKLARRIEDGEPLLLLDVREPSERAYCKIAVPATVKDLHLPIGSIAEQIETVKQAAADLPIVVYCHHGVRSWAVANFLCQQGLSGISNLEGGIDAWSTQVDRVVARY